MGYVGNCGENLVPDYQWLCFEPKLETLVPFGCLVVCYIDLLGYQKRIDIPTYSW
jgi:hypothetical protein